MQASTVALRTLPAGAAFHLPGLSIEGTLHRVGVGSATISVRRRTHRQTERTTWAPTTMVVAGPMPYHTTQGDNMAKKSAAAKKTTAKKATTTKRAAKGEGAGPRWRLGLFRADSGKLSTVYVTPDGVPMPYEQQRVGGRKILFVGEYAGMKYSEARVQLLADAAAKGIAAEGGEPGPKSEPAKKATARKATAKKAAPKTAAAKKAPAKKRSRK